MSFYRSLLLGSLAIATSACSSMPQWTGKYKRDDGQFELYSEADEDMLEVTIVKAGGSLKDQASIIMSFLAKIKDNRATEMQLCRNGLCAKECLSAVVRSKEGMTYESCDEDPRDGTYR